MRTSMIASLLSLAAACSSTASSDPMGTTSGTSSGTSSPTDDDTGTAPDPDSSSTGPSPSDTTETSTGVGTTGEPVTPEVLLPRTSIGADELGVLVNDADPQSVAVAEAYVAARGIPAANVVHLDLAVGPVLSQVDFAAAAAIVESSLGDDVQALAITWTQPYRVDCMSITSAFALGFDVQYCSTPCNETAESPYYDSPSLAPWTDHGLRPTMMLAGETTESVLALIDRGVAADGTLPFGDGYLIRTTDADRSTRSPLFEQTVDLFDHDGGLTLTYLDNADGAGLDYIENTTDVLFYFTGLVGVPQLATNTYLPGAMADHLTSYGGEVPTSSQMSCVAWLEAGATGSYGTVVEPCNYPAKFPNPVVATSHYFRGETLIEAYWKSVRMPGEGLFVGEPLAKPWAGAVVDFDGSTLTIQTTLLAPGVDYDVQAGDSADGPWTTVFTGSVPYPVFLPIVIEDATAAVYRLVEAE